MRGGGGFCDADGDGRQGRAQDGHTGTLTQKGQRRLLSSVFSYSNVILEAEEAI